MPVMTRRSTVDWVLARAAAAEPRVEVRHGVKVAGLLCATGRAASSAVGANPPHVTGLRTDHGELPADLVVDATGRRSPVDDWLARIGAPAHRNLVRRVRHRLLQPPLPDPAGRGAARAPGDQDRHRAR